MEPLAGPWHPGRPPTDAWLAVSCRVVTGLFTQTSWFKSPCSAEPSCSLPQRRAPHHNTGASGPPGGDHPSPRPPILEAPTGTALCRRQPPSPTSWLRLFLPETPSAASVWGPSEHLRNGGTPCLSPTGVVGDAAGQRRLGLITTIKFLIKKCL